MTKLALNDLNLENPNVDETLYIHNSCNCAEHCHSLHGASDRSGTAGA